MRCVLTWAISKVSEWGTRVAESGSVNQQVSKSGRLRVQSQKSLDVARVVAKRDFGVDRDWGLARKGMEFAVRCRVRARGMNRIGVWVQRLCGGRMAEWPGSVQRWDESKSRWSAGEQAERTDRTCERVSKGARW